VKEDTGTIEFTHVSMQELRQRGEIPTTKEGLTIELTLRVGDMLASSGASAKDTVVAMRRICQAYGLARAHVDVNSTMITASYYPGHGLPPITSVRTVAPVLPDLSKAYEVNNLVGQVCDGLPISKAMRRFDRIHKAPTPYPSWVATLATAGISPSISLFYTSSPQILVLALLFGLLVNRFVYLLSRRGMSMLFQQLFGGWLVVAIAAGVTWLNTHPKLEPFGYISPTTIAVGCIFQLVAGARFVAGVQDAIDGFYVTGTARLAEAVMATAGLVAGLVTGLDLVRRLGLTVTIPSAAPYPSAAPAQFAAIIATAICLALSQYANRRTVLVTALVGLVAAATYWSAMQLDAGRVFAAFIGPAVSAFVGTIVIRRWWQIPRFGVINAMGMPFVPGFSLYLGLVQVVGSRSAEADPSRGFATLGTAAAVALAIAAGASFGVFFGRPISEKILLIPRPWQLEAPKSAMKPARGKLAHVTRNAPTVSRDAGDRPLGRQGDDDAGLGDAEVAASGGVGEGASQSGEGSAP
jgi:uncharacterized membrane protein YjjP (DUF1212 family)